MPDCKQCVDECAASYDGLCTHERRAALAAWSLRSISASVCLARNACRSESARHATPAQRSDHNAHKTHTHLPKRPSLRTPWPPSRSQHACSRSAARCSCLLFGQRRARSAKRRTAPHHEFEITSSCNPPAIHFGPGEALAPRAPVVRRARGVPRPWCAAPVVRRAPSLCVCCLPAWTRCQKRAWHAARKQRIDHGACNEPRRAHGARAPSCVPMHAR